MVINGILKKREISNEYSGFSCFDIDDGKKMYHLIGVLPDYPLFIPLQVETHDDTVDENGCLRADKVILKSVREEDTSAFICSDYFSGIGEVKAGQIISSFGVDIFSYIRKNYIDDDELTSAGKEVYNRVKDLLAFEDLFIYIRQNEGTLFITEKLFHVCRRQSVEKLKENPYLYFFFGGDYGTSEKMAAKQRMNAFDRRRVHALVRHAMNLNRGWGNTRMTYHNLVRTCHRREEQIDAGFYTDPIFISQEIKTDTEDYRIKQENGNTYIYFLSDDTAEDIIVSETNRLEASKKSISSRTVSIEDIEKQFDIKYSESQKRALNGIRTSGIKIITGGPGTGKTTLLNGFLYRYRTENPKARIALCAPTGCAARRMKEATGINALTIHKLLNIRPFEKDITDYKRDMINADLVIADETSMLDIKLAATFFSAVKNSATLILLGDKDQLPSIEAGNVLADLIASGKTECYDLTEVFRQKHGSVITENARKVIRGDPELKTDPSFLIKTFDDEKKLTDEVLRLENAYIKAGSPGTLKVFTPSRNKKFRTGTVNMNQLIKRSQDKKTDFTYGYFSYSTGDRVIFTRNNYEKHYYNGGEGIIKSVTRINSVLKVGVELDGEYICLERGDLADIEPAFVMTAHKAQGSECDYAIIIVPKEPKGMLMRKLLYVEITRAKKQVVLLTEGDAYKRAISETRTLRRDTGLSDKLKGKKNE